MLKKLVQAGTAVAVLLLPFFAQGQALPTATGHGQIDIGGGATLGKPDFGQDWIGGVSIFGDFNRWSHVGFEADAHILTIHTPQDLGENTYEVGPRFYWRKKRFRLYGKVLLGYGQFLVQEIQDNPGKYNANSFVYSLGGGLDVDLPHHLTLRAFDLEYQEWPDFLNNGLTPAIGTVGLAYRFH